MKHFGCIIYTNLAPLLLYCCLLLVCKDTSCNGGNGAFGGDLANACLNARIDYIVGPSCTDFGSCASATIGSVGSSCNGFASCGDFQLGGVDLINSCNAEDSCSEADGNGAFDVLIDCCNDEPIDSIGQCQDKDGLDIVNAGGPSCVSSTCLLLSNIA